MFDLDRIFYQHNTETGLIEWFFSGRTEEGIYGPFFDQTEAVQALEAFIKFNIEFSDTGGRKNEMNEMCER